MKNEEYINPLTKQAENELSVCLKELVFGRPVNAQKFIKRLIALAEEHEESESTCFE